MRVYWDPRKAALNREKHGIRFPDAEPVLFDPLAVTIEDRKAEGEQRYITIGQDALGQILVLVFTERVDGIRLISARPATHKERREYEEGV